MSTTPARLDQDRVWAAIDAHRQRLADLLDQLTDAEWQDPSLCAGWTVRDVAAHLTLQQVRLGEVLAMMLRAPGSVDRMIDHAARRQAAALTTTEITARIRGMIGSRRRNFGITHLDALIDALVHSQDIAIPLGRRLDLPVDAAATAAGRTWSMRWPPPNPATKVMKAFRVTATDTAWSTGHGPEVRGPIAAILLVSAGRLAALPQLAGPGAAELAARLQPRHSRPRTA
jgi:uncharacterized protein (TIGR03083 family)